MRKLEISDSGATTEEFKEWVKPRIVTYNESMSSILRRLHQYYLEHLHATTLRWSKGQYLQSQSFLLDKHSTGQDPWYLGRPKGRGQAALAPCLPSLDVLCSA